MPRAIFELTSEDYEALEVVRAALGLRSRAEAVRALIRTAADHVAVGQPDRLRTPSTQRAMLDAVRGAEARVDPRAKAYVKPISPRQATGATPHVDVPVKRGSFFNPQPKGKR